MAWHGSTVVGVGRTAERRAGSRVEVALLPVDAARVLQSISVGTLIHLLLSLYVVAWLWNVHTDVCELLVVASLFQSVDSLLNRGNDGQWLDLVLALRLLGVDGL